jgi:5-bromo-4-chloroindolyl phosphate hydrolysis protein
MPNQQKRNQQDRLATEIYADVDALVADLAAFDTDLAAIDVDLADVNSQIATLVAVANRSATQNLDLRSLRRDKNLLQISKQTIQQVRRMRRQLVRVEKFALLLDGTRARDADVTGSE